MDTLFEVGLFDESIDPIHKTGPCDSFTNLTYRTHWTHWVSV